MADNKELRVIIKAKALAKHTLMLTSNANRYPKKYRFSLVDKMQNKCLEIYEMLHEANRTDLKGNSFSWISPLHDREREIHPKTERREQA